MAMSLALSLQDAPGQGLPSRAKADLTSPVTFPILGPLDRVCLFANNMGISLCGLRLQPQTGGLNNRNSFSQDSVGWKYKIKVLGGLFSAELSLLGL